MICALNEVFNGVSCLKISTVEEGELTIQQNSENFRSNFLSQMKFNLTAPKPDAFAHVAIK